MDSTSGFAAELMKVLSIQSAHELRRYQYLQELWPAVSARELARYHDTRIAPALRLRRGTDRKWDKRMRQRAIRDLREDLKQRLEHVPTKQDGASPPAARPLTAIGQPSRASGKKSDAGEANPTGSPNQSSRPGINEIYWAETKSQETAKDVEQPLSGKAERNPLSAGDPKPRERTIATVRAPGSVGDGHHTPGTRDTPPVRATAATPGTTTATNTTNTSAAGQKRKRSRAGCVLTTPTSTTTTKGLKQGRTTSIGSPSGGPPRSPFPVQVKVLKLCRLDAETEAPSATTAAGLPPKPLSGTLDGNSALPPPPNPPGGAFTAPPSTSESADNLSPTPHNTHITPKPRPWVGPHTDNKVRIESAPATVSPEGTRNRKESQPRLETSRAPPHSHPPDNQQPTTTTTRAFSTAPTMTDTRLKEKRSPDTACSPDGKAPRPPHPAQEGAQEVCRVTEGSGAPPTTITTYSPPKPPTGTLDTAIPPPGHTKSLGAPASTRQHAEPHRRPTSGATIDATPTYPTEPKPTTTATGEEGRNTDANPRTAGLDAVHSASQTPQPVGSRPAADSPTKTVALPPRVPPQNTKLANPSSTTEPTPCLWKAGGPPLLTPRPKHPRRTTDSTSPDVAKSPFPPTTSPHKELPRPPSNAEEAAHRPQETGEDDGANTCSKFEATARTRDHHSRRPSGTNLIKWDTPRPAGHIAPEKVAVTKGPTIPILTTTMTAEERPPTYRAVKQNPNARVSIGGMTDAEPQSPSGEPPSPSNKTVRNSPKPPGSRSSTSAHPMLGAEIEKPSDPRAKEQSSNRSTRHTTNLVERAETLPLPPEPPLHTLPPAPPDRPAWGTTPRPGTKEAVGTGGEDQVEYTAAAQPHNTHDSSSVQKPGEAATDPATLRGFLRTHSPGGTGIRNLEPHRGSVGWNRYNPLTHRHSRSREETPRSPKRGSTTGRSDETRHTEGHCRSKMPTAQHHPRRESRDVPPHSPRLVQTT